MNSSLCDLSEDHNPSATLRILLTLKHQNIKTSKHQNIKTSKHQNSQPEADHPVGEDNHPSTTLRIKTVKSAP